jgi:hypothetical protein
MKNSMGVGNIFVRSLIRETKKSDTTLQQKPSRALVLHSFIVFPVNHLY